MALRFAESGGQYHASNINPAGIWGSGFAGPGNGISAAAPTGRSTTFAYSGGGANSGSATTKNLGGNFGSLYAGFATILNPLPSAGNNSQLVIFKDNGGLNQCDMRVNNSGQLYFTRNGTNLGAGNPTVSTLTVSTSTWYYIEVKAIFGTSSNGTCEVKVNGVVYLTLTGVTNATTTATGAQVTFSVTTSGFCRDFYVVDGDGGTNTGYLGDVTVAELYDNAAGANSAWTVNQGSFTITGVTSFSPGVSVTYTGTITNGATPANAYQGLYFSVSGFTGAGSAGLNGGPWICSASTATTITLLNPISLTNAAAISVNSTNSANHNNATSGTATIAITTTGTSSFIVCCLADNSSNNITATVGNSRQTSTSQTTRGNLIDNTVVSPGSVSCTGTLTSSAWDAVGVEIFGTTSALGGAQNNGTGISTLTTNRTGTVGNIMVVFLMTAAAVTGLTVKDNLGNALVAGPVSNNLQCFYYAIPSGSTGYTATWTSGTTAAFMLIEEYTNAYNSGQSATCAFQNPVQGGIHGGDVDAATTNLGTRPPNDVSGPIQFIKSSTTNQKTDYAHQTLTLTGSIPGVCHVTLARKDDAGSRSIAQICESSSSEEIGSTQSLGNSLTYYQDYIELDPNGNIAWGTTGFNAATFGVKLIS